MRFEAGHLVRVEYTKWGGRPHYVFDGVFLGEDEHGTWLGHRAGTLVSRPGRDGAVLRAVDLDLDVIRTRDQRGTFIDDQDEFEEHQVAYGYPPEVITLAEESAERVYAAVTAGEAPYDESAERWLTALARSPRRA